MKKQLNQLLKKHSPELLTQVLDAFEDSIAENWVFGKNEIGEEVRFRYDGLGFDVVGHRVKKED